MFTRILVPLDGSARAEQAIPVAARIARVSHGTVILMQAVAHLMDIQTEQEQPAEMYSDALVEEGKALSANYLNNVSKKAELVGVKTETRVEYGDIAPALLTALEPLSVDLIVMSSHGDIGFRRWAVGSIAQRVASHSPVPVLALRPGGSVLAEEPVCALVALDGSPLAESVLPPIIQLLAALAPVASKTLHLVRVVDLVAAHGKFVMNAPFEQLRQEAKLEAEQYLTAVAKQLTEDDSTIADLTVTTSVIVNPDVAEALLKSTEHELHGSGRFNLIAMATHGRGGLQRWMMGSVTEHVLYHSRLPLLIVHLPKAQHAHSSETEEPKAVSEKTEAREHAWVGLL